ncbi:TraB/GumN family protein [Glycocaulis profundi]|nr:TraB/GumN family protein [Glycocaulis profundi]
MLKKLAASAAMLAVAFLAAPVMAPSGQAHAQDYAAIQADPALWKVEQDGATVWLFGTFHLLPPELDWRTDAVTEAMTDADTVWFEVDAHSPEAQQEMGALIPRLGLNPQGVTLSSLLDDETNALLAEVAPTVGASPAALEPMRPWLAGLMLAVSQIQQLGFDPTAGVEAVLNAEARAAGKDFRYFETPEQQLGFFADLPEDVQVEMLAQGLRDMAELPAQLETMVEGWATGDLSALDAAINSDMRDEAPEVYDAIIVNRNRAWIPDIQAMIAEGGTHFVAVGAGHLVGDDSVIAMLEAEGFEAVRQ